MKSDGSSGDMPTFRELRLRGDRAIAEWREVWRNAQLVFETSRELRREIHEWHHGEGSLFEKGYRSF
jgi:hypothetical protein